MEPLTVKEQLYAMMSAAIEALSIGNQFYTAVLLNENLTDVERDTILQLRRDSKKFMADIEWNAGYLSDDIDLTDE